MNKSTTIIAIIGIVIVGGILFLFTRKGDTTSAMPVPGFEGTVEEMIVTPLTQTSSTSNEGAEGNSHVQSVDETTVTTVTYSNDGFSPQSITISKGDTVRFVNESSSRMWIGSDMHPTHSLYPLKSSSDCLGSLFDQCTGGQNGNVWEFTFTEAGVHGYHNHLRASKRGTITVN